MDTACRVSLHCFVLFFVFCFCFFDKSTPQDIRIKGTPRMTPTKYTFYHILFAVNHILGPFSTSFLTLYYTLIPNYTNYTQTTNAPFVSFSPKPSSTSLSTVYTRRLFEKSLFSFYFRRKCFPSFKRGHDSRF